MPLNALERGMGLIKQVRDGLSQVTAPALLIYGDSDQIVDKANGPFVLDRIASTDKRLLPLRDSAHELILDVDRERVWSRSTTSSAHEADPAPPSLILSANSCGIQFPGSDGAPTNRVCTAARDGIDSPLARRVIAAAAVPYGPTEPADAATWALRRCHHA